MMVTKENISDFDFKSGGVFLVDKPIEWTSFDVVNKLRYRLKHHLGVKKFKVGHAGTLDPLATGLLIVCCGKETKNIESYQNRDKTYTGHFTLGAITASFDAETEVEQVKEVPDLSLNELNETAKEFQGKITQTPPMYSAVKVNGKVAYKSARKGETLKLKEREVEVKRFEIKKYEEPLVHFEIECSKGTYIRSLANDFGKSLKCGAYLSELRRTRIGEFSIDNAWQLDDLVNSLEAL